MGNPSGERGPPRKRDRNSIGGSGSRRRRRRGGGRGGEGGGVGACILNSENNGRIRWTSQPDGEIELSQANRGSRGVCVEVVPRVQSKL